MNNGLASNTVPSHQARVDVQYAVQGQDIPAQSRFTHWVNAALVVADSSRPVKDSEVSIRIVSENEITELNLQYRHQDKPTNVLSFPCEAVPGVELPLLGDIVICAAVVNNEACQQGKALQDHWAHMVVHGTLHLLGYDHIDDEDAEQMEQLEIRILEQMGIANPYVISGNGVA